ncbi:hypothetical protein ACLK1T_15715 [Escherichia coli]
MKRATIQYCGRCLATILKAHPACCVVAQNATNLFFGQPSRQPLYSLPTII